MSAWYKPCARCGSSTCPAERERRHCFVCGQDPRSTRVRVGDCVWAIAATTALVLAAPGIVVALAGVAVRTAITGEKP